MRTTLLTSLLWTAQLTALGCSASAIETSDTATPSPAAPAPAPSSKDETMRVLVTGFNDWRELGDPPNVWRCRDNPSCRLLLGPPHDQAPTAYDGPLATRLRRRAPDVEWTFATLPVTWDAFAEVPREFDVIINIGLGVYDRFDALQLEAGAYNLRQGTDAAGTARSEPIDAHAAAVLPESELSSEQLAALAGRTIAGYEVLVAQARPDNSYLCNETHFHALTAVAERVGSLRAAYFLHIPYAEHDDYEALAEGVAGVVLSLAER